MTQETKDSNNLLTDTIIGKLETQDGKLQAQEKKIVAVEKKISEIPDLTGDMREIKSDIRTLLTGLQNLQFPLELIKEFTKLLTTGIAEIRRPVQTKVEHHHHVPKLIWAAGGLFLVLCLTCVGWTITAGKLDQYRASDTKYRKLKLLPDSVVTMYLNKLDSIYASNPDSLRANVEQQERLKRERLELIDQIKQVNNQIETGEKGRP